MSSPVRTWTSLQVPGTRQGFCLLRAGANTAPAAQVSSSRGPETLLPHSLCAWLLPFAMATVTHTANWVTKATEVYSPTIQEARSPKSRCRQGHAPPETCRGGSFLPLAASGVAGGPWCSLGCRCVPPTSAFVTCVVLCMCLSSSGYQP